MSVICCPAGSSAAPAANPGVTPRRSGRLASLLGGGSNYGAAQGGGSNVLYVKGAAECILARCGKVMLADGSVVPLDKDARAELTK
jgi:Ca2+-transporting ATPase